jgi:hypothetical protein
MRLGCTYATLLASGGCDMMVVHCTLCVAIRIIKSRRMKWAGHVMCMEELRNVRKVLVGELEGKKPLGRPRHRWEDNIKMDHREVGIEVWIVFIWLTIGTCGSSCEDSNEPFDSIKGG